MKQSEIIEIFREIKNSNGKIAIAVEGGGLRGVVSAAMLKIFEDLGLVDQVDAVAGTSAGAINLAYFLNKDMDNGLKLYKVLANKAFIQPLKWPNAMNLSYLFDEQIAHHFKINWQNLHQHPCDFYISMTNTKTGEGRFIKAQETYNSQELIKCVRASASAPLFSTNKELIDREEYNDGQVHYSIPIQPFLNDRYDVIFCLLTRKKGYRKSAGLINSLFETLALRKYSNEYKSHFSKLPFYYNKTLKTVFNTSKIIPLYLEEEDYIISKMTKNPNEMQKCIDSTLRRFT